MKMNLYISFLLVFFISTESSYGQQDSQYTQYMYNTLSINSAYAGTRDALSILGLYRDQWVGLRGAPKTMNFSIHSPVGKRIGLGLNVVKDAVFISDETIADISFSYQIPTSESAKLSLGVNAGGSLLNVDFSKAYTGARQPGDPNLQLNVEQRFSPRIGVGVFYYTDNFYAGLSSMNLLKTKHFDKSVSTTASERMHLNLITGYVFNFGTTLKFKPALLVKAVGGTPLQVDVSANFLFYEKFTLGAAYRWDAAMSTLAGFQINNKFLIGYAYDWDTTLLSRYNGGSHEVFLRFELFTTKDKILSPRFF